ncbi:hypothetical protein VP01_6542g1, partial [Puccinia sorghi]
MSEEQPPLPRKPDCCTKKLRSVMAVALVIYRCKKLEPLIAVYGIFWKIEYESHRTAYNEREIINAILCDEFFKFQDQITRQSGKNNCKLLGHFKEIQFTQANWIQIKHLNDEFKPFNFLTKEMEGDGPTGAFFLDNYYETIKDLKKKNGTGIKEVGSRDQAGGEE